MGDFSNRVFRVIAQIPRGKVAGYGTVARLMGSPRSARYVGYALKHEPDPALGLPPLPYHRVIFKDGHLPADYLFGGPGVQKEMLEAEGVIFADNDHVDMAACEWDGRNFDPTADLPTAPPADFDWAAELGE